MKRASYKCTSPALCSNLPSVSVDSPFSLVCMTALHVQAAPSFDTAFGRVVREFQEVSGPKERANLLLKLADGLPHMPADRRINANRVMGCTSQVSPPLHIM